MVPRTAIIAVLAVFAHAVHANERQKRADASVQVKAVAEKLKQKITKLYGSGIDDVLLAIDNATDLIDSDTNTTDVLRFVANLEQANAAVDQLAKPDSRNPDLETAKDVAAGLGSVAQVVLMATIPPPFGAAFGALAGTIGGLLGRGGTMRLSTVIDNLLKKRLSEARFKEVMDKSAGGRKQLGTAFTKLQSMMTVSKEEWDHVSLTAVEVNAPSTIGTALMGEMENYIAEVRRDPEQSQQLIALIEDYSYLYYIRITILAMKIQIYTTHDNLPLVAGDVGVLKDTFASIKRSFSFLVTPNAKEGTRIANLDSSVHVSVFRFAKAIGLDILESQKSVTQGCYRIYVKEWNEEYYWETSDDGDKLWVDNKNIGTSGGRSMIDIQPGSQTGYVKLVPRVPGVPIWVGDFLVPGSTPGTMRKVTMIRVKAKKMLSKNENWRLVKLTNGYWYIRSAHLDTPLYIKGYYMKWDYNEPGDQGMFQLKSCT